MSQQWSLRKLSLKDHKTTANVDSNDAEEVEMALQAAQEPGTCGQLPDTGHFSSMAFFMHFSGQVCCWSEHVQAGP